MAFKTITRVSGKPNVIKVNGEEITFGSSKELNRAWERLKMDGYKVPETKNSSDLQAWWG